MLSDFQLLKPDFGVSTTNMYENVHIEITSSTLKVTSSFDVHKAVHRNIISIAKPTRRTNVSNLYYFGMKLYMFRTVFPSIIRSFRL